MEFSTDTFRSFAGKARDVRILVGVGIIAIVTILLTQKPSNTAGQQGFSALPKPVIVPAADIDSRFLDTFASDGILNEASPMSATKSPYWWLNSGGKLIVTGGVGETVQGDLPTSDPWYQEYRDTNAEDTDGGIHPQNLLRLVSRSTWGNVRVEASYFIAKDNLSTSTNRNESNGLLIMSRYRDEGQTLYYAGIRVDGTAVVKKKYKGTYYTMDQKPIFPGLYDHDTNPNLLPHSVWIRLRSDTVTEKNGSVTVTLSMEDPGTAKWKELLSVNDHHQYDNTPPIVGSHSIGLRTDFMDVKFDNILMEKLP